MNLADLKARVERLDQLARGLSREVVQRKEANDPLLYLERKGYLGGLHKAIAGIEEARVALARARQRLEAAPVREPPATTPERDGRTPR